MREPERSPAAENTKTECECDRPIAVNESVFGLGIRCVLCGHSIKGDRLETLRSS